MIAPTTINTQLTGWDKNAPTLERLHALGICWPTAMDSSTDT